MDLEKVKKMLEAGRTRGYFLFAESRDVVAAAGEMVKKIEELEAALLASEAEEPVTREEAEAESPEATEGPTLESLGSGGPPYDAATATGMYDRYEG